MASSAPSELQSILLGIIEVQPLSAVFRRLAQAALEVTGADYAAIGAYDEERRLEHFEPFGMSRREREGIPHLPIGIGLLGEFSTRSNAIRLADLAAHPSSAGFPEGHPPMEAFLGVPLVYGPETLGAFYVSRRPGAPPFDEVDQEQLEALAPYAVIALNNARALEIERHRRGIAEVVAEATRGLQQALDERAVARVLVRALPQLVRDATQFAVCWSDPLSEQAHIAATEGDGALGTIVAALLEEGRAAGEYRLPELLPASEVTLHVANLADGGQLAVAAAAATTLAPDDRVSTRAMVELGIIGFDALHRRKAEEALAQYATRDAVARDLHDEIIQAVYGAGLTLQAAAARESVTKADVIARASEDLNAVIADLRAFIDQLTGDPSSVNPSEMLSLRLESLLSRQLGSEWAFNVRLEGAALDRTTERQLYLIARELISNVERHSQAATALLSIQHDEREIRLTVRDDGVGFTRSSTARESLGLRSVEERVGELDGSVVFESTPGAGTTVLIRVPYVPAERSQRASPAGGGQ